MPRYDVFADLVDAALPRGGPVVVLRAYFDASARPGGFFCVAGFAFAKEQVKKFDRSWWRLFGKYGGCHMKDMAPGAGKFKNVDAHQRGELLKEAVKIIRRHATYGVVASCNKNEVESVLPRWVDGFQGAYPMCCHLAMTTMGKRIEKSGREEEVAYFFESGDEWSSAAHRFMGRTSISPELKHLYRYRSHAFVEKKDALALQAADILAWEWTKFMDETLTHRKRPIRKSLMALVGPNGAMDNKFDGRHVTGEPLRRFAAGVAKLGLEQIELDKAGSTS